MLIQEIQEGIIFRISNFNIAKWISLSEHVSSILLKEDLFY